MCRANRHVASDVALALEQTTQHRPLLLPPPLLWDNYAAKDRLTHNHNTAMPRPHRRDRKSFLLQPHGPRDPTTAAGLPPVPQSTSAVRIRRVCRSVAYRPYLPVASIAESGIAPPSLSGTKPRLFAG
ncbi:hypothetical protein CNYM01_03798 [Colletotrichum nymphaeae SA-01]|uniref:Uncharacterized protein n=1 Tax=Colletotrichum nymphaeae SA-01 TaxID=1460502 RepID=A0A135T3T9_9PEZI|nr:hypothetical protein CNYM01_03798 [Colletotrichum nymphaeae SA-01]